MPCQDIRVFSTPYPVQRHDRDQNDQSRRQKLQADFDPEEKVGYFQVGEVSVKLNVIFFGTYDGKQKTSQQNGPEGEKKDQPQMRRILCNQVK